MTNNMTPSSVRPSRSRSLITRRTSADAIRSRLLFKLGIYDPNFTNASVYNKIRCESFATSGRGKDVGSAKVAPQRQVSSLTQQSSSLSKCDDDEPQDRSSPSAETYAVPLKVHQDPQDGCSDSPHLISSNPSSSTSLTIEGECSDLEPPLSIDECSSSSVTPKSRRGSFIQFDPSITVIPVPSHRSYSPQVHAQLHTPKDEMSFNAMRNTREFIYEGWDWNNVIEENGMYICKVSGEFVHPAHVGLKKVVNPYL